MITDINNDNDQDDDAADDPVVVCEGLEGKYYIPA